jgi:hypothetical protein
MEIEDFDLEWRILINSGIGNKDLKEICEISIKGIELDNRKNDIKKQKIEKILSGINYER